MTHYVFFRNALFAIHEEGRQLMIYWNIHMLLEATCDWSHYNQYFTSSQRSWR